MADANKWAECGSADDADALCVRFERDWSADCLDRITPQLVAWPVKKRASTLNTLVKTDIGLRWHRGEPVELEAYLSRFAELGTSATVAADLVFAEWMARVATGQRPEFGDFAWRFPKQAAELRQLIEQSAVRNAAPSSGSRRQTAGDRDSGVDVGTAPRRDTQKMSLRTQSQVAPLATPPRDTAADEQRPLSVRGSVDVPSTSSSPETPQEPPASQTRTDGDLPESFGRYRVVRKLGTGGMGTVYLAEDTELGRPVALKVPHVNARTDADVLQRFEREAKIAAQLLHPHICKVFDVGTWNGTPYLTMEFVNGRSLAEAESSLSDRQAIQLVRKIAMAMERAHQLQIVHRDLKPANILLTAGGEPKLTDFGLARRLGGSEHRLTQSGMVVGTPAYMALEQLQGEVDQIGPQCDVYSLGVILFELLTGRLPFDVPDDAPAMTLFAKILTTPPDAPSKYRPGLDPQLEAIVVKATAQQCSVRYASMTAFSAALGQYLKSAGRTMSDVLDAAHPRRVARGPTTESQEAIARLMALDAESVGEEEPELPSLAPRRKPKKSSAGRKRVERLLKRGFQRLVSHWRWGAVGVVLLAAGIGLQVRNSNPEIRARDQLVSSQAAQVTRMKEQGLIDARDRSFFSGHAADVTSASFSPDGKWIVSASRDRTVKVWDWQSESLRHDLSAHDQPVVTACFSPNGEQIATGDVGGVINVWRTSNGKLIRSLIRGGQSPGRTASAVSVRFLPDNRRLAVANADQTIVVWDASSGTELFTQRYGIQFAAFSPDGQQFATNGRDGEILLWPLAEIAGTRTYRDEQRVTSLCFSQDGGWLASASLYGEITIRDAKSGSAIRTITPSFGQPQSFSMSFSSDGRKVATDTNSGLILYNVESGEEAWRLMSLHGGGTATSLSFSPDGMWLMSTKQGSEMINVWWVGPDRARPKGAQPSAPSPTRSTSAVSSPVSTSVSTSVSTPVSIPAAAAPAPAATSPPASFPPAPGQLPTSSNVSPPLVTPAPAKTPAGYRTSPISGF